MKYLEKRLVGTLVLVAVSLFQFLIHLPLLPSVMQDEYVYLSQALFNPLSADVYGNFVYSLIYSPLAMFGESFYVIAKLLNTVFLFGFIFVVYLFGVEFIGRKLALLIAVATGFGSISLYSSFFMPEMMFFFFASITLYFLYKAISTTDSGWLWFIASLGSLTLTGLVKPHAFILWIGLLVFLILMLARQGENRRNLASWLIALFVAYPSLKLFLGFVLAGEAGFTFLGRGYEESLVRFLEMMGLASSEALSASSSVATASSLIEPSVGTTALLVTIVLSFITLLIGTFLASAGSFWVYIVRFRTLTDFQVLVGVVAAVYIVAIAAFTALVTLTGDDHSDRILLRYFEFLAPFIILSALIEVNRRELLKTRVVVWTAAASVGAFAGWIVVGTVFDLQISDSAFMTAASYFWILGILPPLAAIVSVIITRNRALNSTSIVAWIFSVVTVLGGVSAYAGFYQINAFAGPADAAGKKLQAEYSDVAGEQILVIGADRRLAFVVKFWSFRADVEHEVAGFGQEVDISLPKYEDYELIVQIPGPTVTGGEVLESGQNYRIISP